MIKMSVKEALKIQSNQIDWYSKSIKSVDVAKIVASATTAHLLDQDGEYDMVTINHHIPRGCSIEHLIGINLDDLS